MIIEDFSHSSDAANVARRAYQASLDLAATKSTDRAAALQAMAGSLKRRQNEILEANTLDLEASRDMAIPDLIVEWLKLTPERIKTTVQILERLGEMPDPIGRVINASYQVDRCQVYCQSLPLGAIALIYEAFPELGAIAAGLCLKSANSLILKGGSESWQTNAVIGEALVSAIDEVGLPSGCLQVLAPDRGAAIRELVTQDQYLNLIIPYGRPSLVQQVVRLCTAPVLRSAMGNCYLYWSPTGSLEMARWMILDSHQSVPDPVNAIEKVLIDRNQKPSSLVRLWNTLKEKGFQISADADLVADFPDLKLAEPYEWTQPYLNKTIAFKVVDSLEIAIGWINRNSSGHADCIATESYLESRQFALDVNSASTFINASPRFWRYQNRGDAIFLGMSNQKGYRRGLIGLDTLTTIKEIVQGNGLF
ncbi:glutamate-5-semialdehyde dehydrogenase [Microcoleus sp. OTE_8_concoct_300]|uniref:glutamate-5-semialdehyde dehydrogenase n=1 Tax=Microcoleus sp. OTE_8_concoct_300 TaxID=2964710 RepID=UPI00403F5E67